MSIFKDLDKIQFPVYPIGDGLIEAADGLVFLDQQLLDDTNMPGITLGQRRLQTHTDLTKLTRLSKAIENKAGLLKQAGNKRYIDNGGNIFVYQKTKFTKLKYHKIKSLDLRTTKTILRVEGVNRPFSLIRPPMPEMCWVGIIYQGNFPWLVYKFSECDRPETRVKI